MRLSGLVVLGAALLLGCGNSSGKGGGGAGAPPGDGTPTSPGDATPTSPGPTTPEPPAAGQCDGSSGKGGGGAPSSGGTSNSPGTQPPGPPERCAGLTAPPRVEMQRHVLSPRAPPVYCRAAVGDASGTLAFPYVYSWGMARGSSIEFVTTKGEVLGSYGTSDGVHVLPQPRGFAATAGPGYGHGPPIVRQLRWDSEARSLADGFWWAPNYHEGADPNGGVLVAGDVSPSNLGTLQHAAVMFEGGGVPYAVRWGPTPLASSGWALGVGVDALGRAIVMTDGSSRFGPGAVSAQWFDRDGTAMTGEFLLVGRSIADPCGRAYTWLETSPLVGGGVAVRRMAMLHSPFDEAQVLVVVPSGADTAQPPPDWMTARPGTRLEIVRGGKGYAVVPYGAPGVKCTQRIELLAPDGTSCASMDLPISDGTCDTGELSVGEDGTVVQQLPLSMETLLDIGPGNPHTCTWRFWPRALR